MLMDNYAEKMINGVVAHELSHIALGHFNQPKLYLYQKLKQIPFIGKKVGKEIERQVNKDVIIRGFGFGLYCFIRYLENIRGRKSKTMSSDEIFSLTTNSKSKV